MQKWMERSPLERSRSKNAWADPGGVDDLRLLRKASSRRRAAYLYTTEHWERGTWGDSRNAGGFARAKWEAPRQVWLGWTGCVYSRSENARVVLDKLVGLMEDSSVFFAFSGI